MSINLPYKNISQQESLTQLTVENNNNWIQVHIIYPIEGYFLPEFVILTIINNFLILTIFIACKDVTKRIKSSIRVYYIATAIGEIFVCIPVHLTFFLGVMFFSFEHLAWVIVFYNNYSQIFIYCILNLTSLVILIRDFIIL